jgi:hypothetical protein
MVEMATGFLDFVWRPTAAVIIFGLAKEWLASAG